MRTRLRKWKHLSSRTLVKNPYEHLEEDTVLLPNGKKKKYFVSNRGHSAVVILATDKQGRILIQKEFRYPVRSVITEFPSGKTEEHEPPLKAAKREFREEAGFVAKIWKKIGTFYASPSRTNLKFHTYHAKGLTFVGKKPDFGEFVEHEWVTPSRLRQMVKDGTIQTQTVLATIHLFFQ